MLLCPSCKSKPCERGPDALHIAVGCIDLKKVKVLRKSGKYRVDQPCSRDYPGLHCLSSDMPRVVAARLYSDSLSKIFPNTGASNIYREEVSDMNLYLQKWSFEALLHCGSGNAIDSAMADSRPVRAIAWFQVPLSGAAGHIGADGSVWGKNGKKHVFRKTKERKEKEPSQARQRPCAVGCGGKTTNVCATCHLYVCDLDRCKKAHAKDPEAGLARRKYDDNV